MEPLLQPPHLGEQATGVYIHADSFRNQSKVVAIAQSLQDEAAKPLSTEATASHQARPYQPVPQSIEKKMFTVVQVSKVSRVKRLSLPSQPASSGSIRTTTVLPVCGSYPIALAGWRLSAGGAGPQQNRLRDRHSFTGAAALGVTLHAGAGFLAICQGK